MIIHVRFSGFDSSSGLWASGGGGPPDLLPEKKLVGDARVGWGQGFSPPQNPTAPGYNRVEGPPDI